MRVAILFAFPLIDQAREATLLRRYATAADSNRNVAATIKRIHRICERGTLIVVFGDRDGQQFAKPATLQGMNHTHRQNIIAIIANVGVEYQ